LPPFVNEAPENQAARLKDFHGLIPCFS
jgi:hypothetical protein